MAFWNRNKAQKQPSASELLDMSQTQLRMVKELMTMATTRADNYRFGGGAGFIPTGIYEQQAYQSLYELYTGSSTSEFQLGALFAQPIVKFFTAFIIGNLPHIVVRERAKVGGASSGAKITELSTFGNQFLSDQHARLIRLQASSLLYGDAYGVFGFDRNIEALSPYPDTVSPGFTLFSGRLASFSHKIKKYIQLSGTGDESGEKAEVEIERFFNDQEIYVNITTEEAKGELKLITQTPVIKAPNTLGRCPVVHLPNNPITGSAFGWSEFHSCIPFMKVYHDTLAAGFTAQQYHGKPILQVYGITSNVTTWLKRTFGLEKAGTAKDVSDAVATAMQEFFIKHKFLAFSDQARAEFIESKYPTGATEEIAKLAVQGIVRTSMIPEFLFGVAIESANASVREQYVGLKNRVREKQVAFGEVIKRLVKWAFYYYSTVSSDPDTGAPLDTYGFISNPEELENFQVDVIWPPVLNSDEMVKIQALTLLQSMGALSYQTAYEAWPEYVPDAEEELRRISKEFQDDSLPPKTGTTPFGATDGRNANDQAANRQSQSKRDNKGRPGDNSGGSGSSGGSK